MEKFLLFDQERKVNKLILHSGKFHADDVTLAALILECINPDCVISRTNVLDIDNVEDDTIVADIGNMYDGYQFFDHHQREEIETPKSALGLFWDDFGNKDHPAYTRFNEFVNIINLIDTGAIKTPDEYCSGISAMNPFWSETITESEAFDNAVLIVRELIRAIINNNLDVINECYDKLNKRKEEFDKCSEMANEYLEKNAKLIPVSPEYSLLDLTDRFIPYNNYVKNHSDIVAIITPGRIEPAVNVLFANRDNLFPEEWIDATPAFITFIHKSRFLAAFANKESVIKYFEEVLK